MMLIEIASFFSFVVQWTTEQVNQQLKAKMDEAFQSMWNSSHEYDVPLRTGAFTVSLRRVVRATVNRGFN